jgi:hypothetical protein
MRRAIFALTTLLVIIFSMQSIAQMVAVEANPFSYPTIGIDSPDVVKAEIYQTASVPISVSVYPHQTNTQFVDIFYSLDGGPNTTLCFIRYETSSGYFGRGTLENLTNGYHTVKAYSTDTQGNIISDSTTFLVNTTLRLPTILLSPMNITYDSNEIPLTYTIDNSSYHVYYNLDNSADKRMNSNITLSALSDGQHSLTIRAYGNDVNIGIYTKQTANFTIDTTNPFPVPTPTVPEFPGLVIVPLLLSLFLVAVLIRHRKTISQNKPNV